LEAVELKNSTDS